MTGSARVAKGDATQASRLSYGLRQSRNQLTRSVSEGERL